MPNLSDEEDLDVLDREFFEEEMDPDDSDDDKESFEAIQKKQFEKVLIEDAKRMTVVRATYLKMRDIMQKTKFGSSQ